MHDWWRRFHRVGHEWLEQYSNPMSWQVKQCRHRWAGHTARMAPRHFLASTIRCRGMQWWRWQQTQPKSKWVGYHPQSFKAWRWEDQLAKAYGEGLQENWQLNDGWLRTAQNREEWRALERSYMLEQ